MLPSNQVYYIIWLINYDSFFSTLKDVTIHFTILKSFLFSLAPFKFFGRITYQKQNNHINYFTYDGICCYYDGKEDQDGIPIDWSSIGPL